MNTLFLGYMLKKEDLNKFIGPSVAGNKMQLGIAKGIANEENDVTILSIIPIATYPKEKKIFIYKKKEKLNQMNTYYIPFINIFFLKQLSQMFFVAMYTIGWIYKNRKQEKRIITFNMFPNIALPVSIIKKITRILTVCIFADPPIFTENLKKSKKIEKKISEKLLNNYDKFIVLNEYVVEKYNIKKPFIVIDGGFDKTDFENDALSKNKSKSEKYIILYSGALTEYNGIPVLLQAFKELQNTEVELHIYGDGNKKELVLDYSKKDKRICYFGSVENSEILLLQRQADLLINPRLELEEISKLTFPSKIIEYFLSETPILTTKLNGLTHDYLKYVDLIEESTVEGVRQSITKFLTEDYENKKVRAKCGAKYIYSEKNWGKQSEKILKFLM